MPAACYARSRSRCSWRHFYDGTPCYFATTGQLDQDSFTDDDAGRRGFEIGEHLVLYEFTQLFEASPPFQRFYCLHFGSENPFLNNEFACTGPAYWVDDPIGLWKQGLVNV